MKKRPKPGETIALDLEGHPLKASRKTKKKITPEKIFWSQIYKIQDLSSLIRQMSQRQLDEKTLTIVFKRMNDLTKRMEVVLERLEDIEVKD